MKFRHTSKGKVTKIISKGRSQSKVTKALVLGIQANKYFLLNFISKKNLMWRQKKASYNKTCFKPYLILKIIGLTPNERRGKLTFMFK